MRKLGPDLSNTNKQATQFNNGKKCIRSTLIRFFAIIQLSIFLFDLRGFLTSKCNFKNSCEEIWLNIIKSVFILLLIFNSTFYDLSLLLPLPRGKN